MIYHAEPYQYGNGWSALVREVPGCIAAAESREETERLITEALRFHLNLAEQPLVEYLVSA